MSIYECFFEIKIKTIHNDNRKFVNVTSKLIILGIGNYHLINKIIQKLQKYQTLKVIGGISISHTVGH